MFHRGNLPLSKRIKFTQPPPSVAAWTRPTHYSVYPGGLLAPLEDIYQRHASNVPTHTAQLIHNAAAAPADSLLEAEAVQLLLTQVDVNVTDGVDPMAVLRIGLCTNSGLRRAALIWFANQASLLGLHLTHPILCVGAALPPLSANASLHVDWDILAASAGRNAELRCVQLLVDVMRRQAKPIHLEAQIHASALAHAVCLLLTRGRINTHYLRPLLPTLAADRSFIEVGKLQEFVDCAYDYVSEDEDSARRWNVGFLSSLGLHSGELALQDARGKRIKAFVDTMKGLPFQLRVHVAALVVHIYWSEDPFKVKERLRVYHFRARFVR